MVLTDMRHAELITLCSSCLDSFPQRYTFPCMDKTKIIFKSQVLEVTLVYYLVFWLIRRKARVQSLDQTSKQKYEIISSATSSQLISCQKSESK